MIQNCVNSPCSLCHKQNESHGFNFGFEFLLSFSSHKKLISVLANYLILRCPWGPDGRSSEVKDKPRIQMEDKFQKQWRATSTPASIPSQLGEFCFSSMGEEGEVNKFEGASGSYNQKSIKLVVQQINQKKKKKLSMSQPSTQYVFLQQLLHLKAWAFAGLQDLNASSHCIRNRY